MNDKSQFQKAKKCCFKRSRKVENELNDISQDFDNHSTDLVDRLFTWFIWAGLKYSYDDKIKNKIEWWKTFKFSRNRIRSSIWQNF